MQFAFIAQIDALSKTQDFALPVSKENDVTSFALKEEL